MTDKVNHQLSEGERKARGKFPQSVVEDFKLPFNCVVGTEPQEVQNPYSGESIVLMPQAVAVYECIKGAEVFQEYDTMRKGIDWFQQHYPKEYMVLLD